MGCFLFYSVRKCRLASERRKQILSDLIEIGLKGEQIDAFGK